MPSCAPKLSACSARRPGFISFPLLGALASPKKSSQFFFLAPTPKKKLGCLTLISFIGPVLGSPKWSSFSHFGILNRGPQLLIAPPRPVVVGSSLSRPAPRPYHPPLKKACSATNVPQIFSKVPPSRGSPLSPASYPECSKNYVAGLRFSRVLLFPSNSRSWGCSVSLLLCPGVPWSFIILYRSPGAKRVLWACRIRTTIKL